jgi:hypothetical protein
MLLESVRYLPEDTCALTDAKKTILKNGVFWDVTPRGSCKNRRFGETQHLFHQGGKNR